MSYCKSSPRKLVVATKVTFAKCRTTLQYTIRFTKRLHTHHLDQDYCTHTNVSGRNNFVCLACCLYMFCAAPPNPPFIDAHSDTNFCYWAPEFSPVTHYLLDLTDQNLYKETPTLILQCYNIGSQCGVSFNCSFPLICNIKAAFII